MESSSSELRLGRFPLPSGSSSSKDVLPPPLSNSTTRELRLPNGDIYSGGTTLSGNLAVAEGSGRYMWSSSSRQPGCLVYEGEWSRGMMHGHGRTMWPSGAVYQGDYSGGYMDGKGSYHNNHGYSYKGSWKLNCKHGFGVQTYPNGDVFQGSWVHGEIEGHGCTYTWANGNTYVGDMRNGAMSGKGILTMRSNGGDSFQGNWLDGMMHGYGVYTWQDRGCYVGTWTRGLKDGNGTFYPKRCRGRYLAHIDELRQRGLLPDDGDPPAAAAPSSRTLLHSSSFQSWGNLGKKKASLERRWSLGVAIEKLIIGSDDSSSEMQQTNCHEEEDDSFPILEREYTQGVLISEVVANSWKNVKPRQRKDIKRPGETIIKGHMSYDLMLSLQLGIRYTVGKITPILRREVRASDYGPRASFWMNFPQKGSRLTPSHRAQDFKWRDYCPLVFRNLREMFKIDAADYMISICGSDALRELSSPGKSGSIFFLSQDDRFMIKTLRKSEVQVLLRMLPDYYQHVQTYDNTLVTKFFGLHRVKPSSGQKFRFVVMGNMFCTQLRIHRRFDLKGSSLGRCTDKIEIDENTTLKDLDLNYSFYLDPTWRDTLLKQIETDSRFLRDQGIMDYSLLLGFHYRAPQELHTRASNHKINVQDGLTLVLEEDHADAYSYPEGLVLVQRCSDQKGGNGNAIVGPHVRGSRLRSSSANFEEVDLLLPGTARLQIQLGVNMPARAEQGGGEEASLRRVYDVVLYIGIIDILQEYSLRKKIEHAYKSIKYDSLSISVVEPRFYSDRFLQFIRTVFPPNA